MKLLSLICFSFLLLATCKSKDKNGTHQAMPGGHPAAKQENTLTGVVLETMDVAGYTYVRIKADPDEIWAAAPKTKTAVGDTIVLSDPMLMKQHASKTLNRTFETIYFASSLTPVKEWTAGHQNCKMTEDGHNCAMTGESKEAACGMGDAGKGPHPKIETAKNNVGKIEKASGGISLTELFAKTDAFQGKTVLIRGKVVKANYGILNKTWIHIQDGSGDDLTVTTASTTPKKDDIVLVQGVFSKDKDIGMGYQFKGIVEDAKVTVEK